MTDSFDDIRSSLSVSRGPASTYLNQGVSNPDMQHSGMFASKSCMKTAVTVSKKPSGVSRFLRRCHSFSTSSLDSMKMVVTSSCVGPHKSLPNHFALDCPVNTGPEI